LDATAVVEVEMRAYEKVHRFFHETDLFEVGAEYVPILLGVE
jgi:hypothetical protein